METAIPKISSAHTIHTTMRNPSYKLSSLPSASESPALSSIERTSPEALSSASFSASCAANSSGVL